MPTREEMQSLAQDIVRSYEERSNVIPRLREAEAGRKRTAAQEIAQRKSDVGAMLKGFDDAHAAMSKGLKADLAKVAPALREAEAERKRVAAQEISQRKSDVVAMLKGFDDAHAAMSKGLKADLAKVAPALRGAEAERKRAAAQEISQRKSDVGAMLKGFREEQAGVRDEWQKLTATMQSKRGVLVAAVAPPRPPFHEVAEEPVAEVLPEVVALRDRVFTYLADHLNGTRMTELEQEFGLPRIQMARVLKSLTDENKVEKRDFLYYAV